MLVCINRLPVRIFSVFEHNLLEDGVLHKGAWVATLLGTHLRMQDHKKVKFPGRNGKRMR